MNNTNGTATTKTFGVTAVFFADDTTNLTEFSQNFGLEGLNSNFAKGILLGTQGP